MRKILFRGKAFFNGEWAYGSLAKVQDENVIRSLMAHGMESYVDARSAMLHGIL